jgi:recombination protein RecT
MNNQLVKRNQNTFSNFIGQDAIKKKINSIVGGDKGQTFITAMVSAVSSNPALAKCDNSTILSAALVGESLGLSPSPQLGHYYMVPFNDSKNNRTVATFQLGYKGYIQLAMRSGQYKKLNVLAIKLGELIDYDPLNEEIKVNLIEDDEERENTETIGYYAMFEYINGFRKTMFWSKKKMLSHALKYSKGFAAKKGYTFWEKDFDSMAYKTMLRQLISKWGIMSVELQKAYASDMAVIKDNNEVEYVDNEDITQEPIQAVEEQPKTKKVENQEDEVLEQYNSKQESMEFDGDF